MVHAIPVKGPPLTGVLELGKFMLVSFILNP